MAASPTPSWSAQSPTRARSSVQPRTRAPASGVPSGSPRRAVQVQVGLDLPVGGDGALELDARAVRVDEEDADAVGRHGRDEHTGRDVRGGHRHLRPVESPGAAVRPRGGGRVHRVVHAGLGERGRQHHVTAGDAGQPRVALRLRPPLGDGERAARHRGPQRDRRHDPTLLLEHEAELEHAEPAAADVVGQAQPEEVRVGELRPQRTVDALVARLDGLHALHRGGALEDLLGEVARRLLLVAEREVHVSPPA